MFISAVKSKINKTAGLHTALAQRNAGIWDKVGDDCAKLS